MSRDSTYRLHLTIGIIGFVFFIMAAFAAIVLALIKMMTTDEANNGPTAFAVGFTAVAGFAIPVALAFLSYVRQVSRCYERCPTPSGFADCLARISLIPILPESPGSGGDA